jgi:hypothetical protein
MVESTGKPIIEVAHNADAPIIYFDAVSACGSLHGAIQLELVAHTLVLTGPNATRTELVTTAHLRCSPTAAGDLRAMIGKTLDALAAQAPVGLAN